MKDYTGLQILRLKGFRITLLRDGQANPEERTGFTG